MIINKDGKKVFSTRSMPIRHYLFLFLGLVLLALFLVESFRQYDLGKESISTAQKQEHRLNKIDELLTELLSAETAVRGYALSGDKNFLKPYDDASPRISELIKFLRIDLEAHYDIINIFRALDEVVFRKVERMESIVATRSRNDSVPIQNIAQANNDMASIRAYIAELREKLSRKSLDAQNSAQQAIYVARQVNLALGISSIVLLLALFALMLREVNTRSLVANNLENEKVLLDEKIRERTKDLNAMAKYLNEVRESEKQRLARELHDEMGAILTSAKMDISWIERNINSDTMPPLSDRFRRLSKHLSDGMALKRRIIDNLHPPLFEQLGLSASLEGMIDDFHAATGIKTEFDTPEEDISLPTDKALALYRIVQESLNNIRKYADAKNIKVVLKKENNWVKVSIADDGCGFDPGLLTATHGILGMRYRVNIFDGKFNLTSAHGKGTHVEASLPI